MFNTLRETHPYRLLLVAVMAVVVMAQLIAMVMVTQSQVQKAQAHYSQERRKPEAAARVDDGRDRAAANTATEGVVNVGYVVAR